MNRHALAVMTLAAAATSGCFGANATHGQNGRDTFSYASCDILGCDLGGSALAAGGARDTIQVQGASFASVQSSSPNVATFSRSGTSNDVDVTSGMAGDADLVLLDSYGKEVDRATVHVHSTAKLAFTQGWMTARPQILEGAVETFHVTTLDSTTATLLGTGAVRFSLTGSLAPAPAFAFGDAAGFAGSAGTGRVSASCDHASAAIDVDVVPIAALTGLGVAAPPNVTDDKGVVRRDVVVTAQAPGGLVYGARCAWALSDPSVTIDRQGGASLEGAPQESTTLVLGKTGAFSATCTVGALTTTIALSR